MNVFYSYSHRDEDLRDELEVHLSILKRQGIIESWHDRKIQPGSDWQRAIEDNLGTADVFLLLVSADFLASDYCYGWEVSKALERHAKGEAIVVPVILRACDWHASPLARLQALPKDGKPVTSWANRDEAWTDVARGIRRTVSDFTTSHKPLKASVPEEKEAPVSVQNTAPPEEVSRRESAASQGNAGTGMAFELGKFLGKHRMPRRESFVSQGEASIGVAFKLGRFLRKWVALVKILCALGIIVFLITFASGVVSVFRNSKGGDVSALSDGLIGIIIFSSCFYFLKRLFPQVRKRDKPDAQADE